MKTIFLISFLLTCLLSFTSAQNLTDDIYFTPADAKKEAPKVKVRADKPRYKNGAKEIIFKDSSQGKTVVLDQDTVYFLSEMNDSITMEETTDIEQEEGYYLNGFEGGEMEYEYAERIRRFHNPRFSIHISDPQYMDIYFLDDSKWNVYIDGSYAWVTPTWTNPYWYNYYWAPYSYSSWYWRTNPYAFHSWYYGYPWTYGPYGWMGYSPWSYGYYGWGYPYYRGYYGGYYGGYYDHYYGGWGYPSYYYPYYWGSYTTVSRNRNYSEPVRRRALSGSSRNASSVGTSTRISGGNYSPAVGRSSVVSNERSSGSTSTGTRPTELRSTVKSTSNVGTARSAAINTRISGIDTRTRTVTTSGNINRENNTIVPTVRQTQTRSSTSGTVNSPTRSTRTVTTPTHSSTTVRAGTGGSSTLRSTAVTPGRSSSSSTSTYTPSVRSSSSSSRSTYSAPTRSSSSSSSSSYSAPSRSSSSSSYSAPSRSSSSSSSGRSSRSSGGGGRR